MSSSTGKPPCQIHHTAVIADKAQLTGTHPIKIGEGSIIQPYAKISSDGGPVTIGADCVVFEAVMISVPKETSGEVVLGDNVCVESGAQISAATVADHCEIGIASRIEAGAVLGKHCKIAPKLIVTAGEQLPDFTVVYGNNERRTDTTAANNEKYRESRQIIQQKQIEMLRRIIPNAASKWTAP